MSIDNIMKTDLMRYEESCEDFINEGLITDFVRVVKKGKEAVVVCCKAHESLNMDYIALKLYRERKYRNFRNDSIYQEGKIWDQRALRAIKKNTETGMQAERSVWVRTEYEALDLLFDLGLNVPEPVAHTEDAVAMAFIGDEEYAAPLLKSVRFESPQEAERCFDKLIDHAWQMLNNGIVHGDLSPFNILYHKGEPWIIDFPQSCNPNVNINGYDIFLRDIHNLCNFFEKHGVHRDANELTMQIWEPVYGPTLSMGL